MYLPVYYHNGFVATHALGYMMYRCTEVIISDPRHRCAQVHELPLLLRSNEDLEGPRVLKLLLEQWA